jgi:hypothetical protein
MTDEINGFDANTSGSVPEPGFDLLALVQEQRDLTIRDDQYEYAWFLDAIRLCRDKGGRFRLVDSGRFDRFQLEWLMEAGADLYTSSQTRGDLDSLTGLQRAAKRGRAILAFLQSGSLPSSEDEDAGKSAILDTLGRDGVHIYLTNREASLDFGQLGRLAETCQAGGTRLVYYHHGAFVPELEDLARSPLWIHLSDDSLREQEAAVALLDLVTSSATRAEFVLMIQGGIEYQPLKDLLSAGAYVQFQRAQFDYRSPFKELERAAAKRRPDFRAFYLYPSVML